MGAIYAIETYTYEDYKLWKGDWELVNGLPLAMSPSPTREHQKLSMAMSSALFNQVLRV